jgi:CheY-like chemotaxis protein
MAAPFSIEHIARVRDGSRRLATKSAHHELAIRKCLTDAESAFEQARTEWTNHDGSPADRLSKVLQSQMLRRATDLASVRQLCVAARENTLAAERLATDMCGPQGRFGIEAGLGIAVLVVDDYEDSREWLSVLLENAGFTVRTATNGLAAVLAAYELQPAVIVMDVMMPVLDGIEAARLIKAIDELRDTRMIAYTARVPQPEISEFFTAVIRKPSPPDVVVETVKRLAAA